MINWDALPRVFVSDDNEPIDDPHSAIESTGDYETETEEDYADELLESLPPPPLAIAPPDDK